MNSPLAAQLRLRGRVPHVELIERSIAMQVRDGALARIKLMPFFKGFTFRKSHALVVATNLMPYCCVYFMGESLGPDGNANTGEIRFQSEAHLGFSVFMLNNDPDAMEDKLDFAYQAIMNGLLRDPTFYYNPYYQIESFTRGNRRHVYGNAGGLQNNETPYAELRAELYCSLGAIEYEPIEETMLETVHVETVVPPEDTDDQNQHVFTIYDVNTLGDTEEATADDPMPIKKESK